MSITPPIERERATRNTAAIYVRMSTEHQQYSTENQRAKIEGYATERNLEIVRVYADDGKSGLNIKGRPGLQALLRDIQTGAANFGVILVYDVSRWGRFQDPDEAGHYEFLCKRAGIRVAYCAEEFENDGSPVSSIVKGVKRAMAGEFSRELSVKVTMGQKRIASMGFRLGGGARTYGYHSRLIGRDGKLKALIVRGERKSIQTDHVVLEPGPKREIEVVQQVFDWFTNEKIGESEIARRLNRSGRLNSRSAPWSHSSIKHLLTNEAYIGNNIFNKVTTRLGAPKVANTPDAWTRKDASHPALIAKSVFDEAAKRFEARAPKDYGNEHMLMLLRNLLAKHKRLSTVLIDSDAEVPSSSTYAAHFGSILNAYCLAGYMPKRNSPFARINTALEKNCPDLKQAAQQAVGERLLTPDGVFAYSLLLAEGYLQKVKARRPGSDPDAASLLPQTISTDAL